MKQKNRNKAAVEIRRATAAIRKAAHAQLTPQQKLAKLDDRLGKEVGAVRERIRLKLMIAKSASPVSKETAASVFGTDAKKSKGHGSKTKQAQK